VIAVSSGNDSGPDDVRVDPLEWPDFEDSGFWSRARRRERIVSSMFLLWLVPIVVPAIHLGRPAAVVVTLSVTYAAGFLSAWWVAPRWSPARRTVLVCVLFASGIGLNVAAGPAGSPTALGYALSSSTMLLPLAWARVIGGVCVALCALLTWRLDGRVDTEGTLVLALIAVITLSLSRSARLVGKLRQARSEVRALAVAGERARLARDLHDVLGHSLTTITVKTALARRLLESEAPTERVLEEVRDAEDLSRRALADVRSTVSGQRRVSLAAELVSARAALRAAGIDADLPHAVDDVLTSLEEPLAYVLREGSPTWCATAGRAGATSAWARTGSRCATTGHPGRVRHREMACRDCPSGWPPSGAP
jgi:two-component system sensor histidine kinase DesK